MRTTLVGAVILATSLVNANAQVIYPMEFKGQATMNSPKGVVEGCGIRVVGSQLFKDGQVQRANVVDASVNIFSAGFGAVKGGWQVAQMVEGKPKLSAINAVLSWIRVADAQPLAAENGKPVLGETPGFTMYSADLVESAKTQTSIADGSNLRVAFARPDGAVVIFSGRVLLEPADREQFELCVESLLAELQVEPSK